VAKMLYVLSIGTSRRYMTKKRCKPLLAILAMGSFLSLSAGGVETATYCDTLTISGHSLEDNHTLPLFDPGLGSLVRVDLTLDLKVQQNFGFENKETNSQAIDAESEALLQITLPDKSSISANASSSVSEELAAYDGEMDFSGQSGRTIEGVESKGSVGEQYPEPSDFVASFQNETISLPAAISFRRSAPGTIVFSNSADAESKICVTYTYEPKGSGAREKGDSK
jgi:hypothetical protein